MTLVSGQRGEEVIAGVISQKGWTILARNYHSRFGEIDIIALDGREIVFIEVKLRTNLDYGEPHASVTPAKGQKMLQTAHLYLLEKNWEDREYRFDVFGILEEGEQQSIEHLSNVALLPE